MNLYELTLHNHSDLALSSNGVSKPEQVKSYHLPQFEHSIHWSLVIVPLKPNGQVNVQKLVSITVSKVMALGTNLSIVI